MRCETLTQPCGLHSRCCVDSVSKQTVPRHRKTHYSCYHWACKHSMQEYRHRSGGLIHDIKAAHYSLCVHKEIHRIELEIQSMQCVNWMTAL